MSTIVKSEYMYECHAERVVDGDTLDLVVDLGFSIHAKIRVRLTGVDTPELRDPDESQRLAAREASVFVADWVSDDTVSKESDGRGGWYIHNPLRLVVFTHKTGKYGRWLAEIYKDGSLGTLTHDLKVHGYAKL